MLLTYGLLYRPLTYLFSIVDFNSDMILFPDYNSFERSFTAGFL